ncbi:TetR/AcrR family transcriptional regulator [Actinoplanes sp. NPDC051633]|uniref:TetR/AcrR family transcriptional regulator n=1 Tax=Actinoplanes sp. NPDC051633 TaxID=3155670 RepID=UPI003426814F
MAVKRRYESTHRQDQARQTRRAILDAAAELFVDPGYAATPLTAVAARAGVAVQTLYKVFGSKKALLSALVDVTIAGDDDPVPLPARGFVEAVQAEGDLRAKLERFAVHLTEVHARQARVMTALAGAATADPEAAAIWRKNVEDRRRGMTMFAGHLVASGLVTKPVEAVADVLWLAMDIRNYDWLVRERGWSAAEFRRWYVTSVAGALEDEGVRP